MQTKLLRFVQEKHFTQVGGNKLLSVDVKIIAVTNRDLAQEVEQGTFRKDLYYRLNVLTLHNPPLRDRLDDLPLLAQHFLNKFAKQFSLEKKTLSPDAMNNMRRYSWPGNIRELENRLMQATLLGDGKIIDWSLLNIDTQDKARILPTQPQGFIGESGSNIVLPPSSISLTVTPQTSETDATNGYLLGPQTETFPDTETYLSHLALVLHTQIAAAAQQAQFFHAPFGTWIEDELIVQTYFASNRKMRITAARLSISQSTARRRVDKIIAHNERTTHGVRPENWQQVTIALSPLTMGQVLLPDCINKIKLLILEVILQTPVCSLGQAAEMLGVSQPTFYKLKKELELASE
jgi:DNA-binding NtrC family response regulator